jgi:hypothetical protein
MAHRLKIDRAWVKGGWQELPQSQHRRCKGTEGLVLRRWAISACWLPKYAVGIGILVSMKAHSSAVPQNQE